MSDELDELFAAAEPFIKKVKEDNKLCNGCQQIKPLSEFNDRRDRGSSDRYGKISKCRVCTTAASRAWYYGDHDKTKALARATQYRRRHAGRITDQEAKQLAESNVGYCDICSGYGVIFIDHDHETEMRRGFLCNRCNFSIGGFQDSVELLLKAAAYLQRYGHLK